VNGTDSNSRRRLSGAPFFTLFGGGPTTPTPSPVPPTPPAPRVGVDFALGIALGDGVYTTQNGGSTLTRRTVGSPLSVFLDVAVSADGTKLAVVDADTTSVPVNGFIYTSVNGGASFAANLQAGAEVWTTVGSSADGSKLYAAAARTSISAFGQNFISTSTDGGKTWTRQTVGLQLNNANVALGPLFFFRVKASADGTKAVAVASDLAAVTTNYLFTTINGGITWTLKATANPGAYSPVIDVALSADGNKILASTANVLSYSDNFAATFTPQNVGNGADAFISVSMSSDGGLLAAGTLTLAGGPSFLYTSRNPTLVLNPNWVRAASLGTKNWGRISMTSTGTKIVAPAGSNLISAAAPGLIYTSVDSGLTFAEKGIAQNWLVSGSAAAWL